MRQIIATVIVATVLFACNNSGDASGTGDSAEKDRTTITPGGIDTANDTMSYERMPNKIVPDSVQ